MSTQLSPHGLEPSGQMRQQVAKPSSSRGERSKAADATVTARIDKAATFAMLAIIDNTGRKRLVLQYSDSAKMTQTIFV